jgi:hypothetical protein
MARSLTAREKNADVHKSRLPSDRAKCIDARMNRLIAILFAGILAPAVAEAESLARCESVRLASVPAAARTKLAQVTEGAVCRTRRGDAVVYRAHERDSSITVEVAADGEILWRHWRGE